MKRAVAILCLLNLSSYSIFAQAPTLSNPPLMGIPVPVPPGTVGIPEAVLSIPGVSGPGAAPTVEQQMPKGAPVTPNAPVQVVQPAPQQLPAQQIVSPPQQPAPAPQPQQAQWQTLDPLAYPAATSFPIAPTQTTCCDFWSNQCGYRLWGSADYLLWWMDKGPLPAPLVTSGMPGAAPPGALYQPGTTFLFGGSGLNYQQFSGLRATAGAWIDPERRFGVEVSGFYLFQNAVNFSAYGNGAPILGLPFTNAVTGSQSVFPVSGPGLAGSVNATSDSRLWSGEASGLYHLHQGTYFDVAFLAGFRTLDLTENLKLDEIEQNIATAGGLSFGGHPVATSSSVNISDSFGTENRFYGGQVGFKFRLQHDIFFIDVTTKAALGVNHETVTIDGWTTLNTPTGTTADRGGLLASGSNLGSYSRDVFAVIPEGNIQFGAQVRSWMVVKLGYNFMYWSSVVRPGNQIDQVINPNRVPASSAYGGADNVTRPAFNFQNSSFWVQGMTVGLEFRY